MTSRRNHPAAWALWFVSALAVTSLIKNPLYQILLIGALSVSYLAGRDKAADTGSWLGFLRFGLVFAAISIIYNILISHHGQTVLLRLPDAIPVIGGPLTAEAAVFGTIFGLTFLCGIMAFTVFNEHVAAAEILRILPARLRGSAVVMAVALNFIPATTEAAADIREAQTVRGLDYGSGVTGAVKRSGAVLAPLIVTGLEKAVTTAESMESRGFGNPNRISAPRQKRKWAGRDYIVALAGFAPLAVIAWAFFTGNGFLAYQPYPQLTVPGFSPLIGLSLAAFALTAAV